MVSTRGGKVFVPTLVVHGGRYGMLRGVQNSVPDY